MFVTLSRLCPVRYCIVRHVGFLLGHGRPAGDADAPADSIAGVIQLLKRPTPWNRDMESIYARLEGLTEPLANWPEPRTEMEDLIFACAAVVFTEPARGETARLALLKALGPRHFEYLAVAPQAKQKRRKDPKRVLLIEDNKDAADTLSELISLIGFDVDVAYDGRSALLRAIATPPDLVLCDLGLPGGMDGYAVARALRAEPRLHHARLIAVSGYSQPKDHANAKQAGFDRLVSKPNYSRNPRCSAQRTSAKIEYAVTFRGLRDVVRPKMNSRGPFPREPT